MTTATKTTYVRIDASQVPGDARFDIPRALQGQTVEIAYGGFERGEHDHGDMYMRRHDRSTGLVEHYRLADAE